MAFKGSAVRFWRTVHLYFGLFISPAMLFFALTGIAQTLSLHESAGTSYKPPAWLATLGQIHKKQTWKIPVRRDGGATQTAPASAAPAVGDAVEPQLPRSEGEHYTQGDRRPRAGETSAPQSTMVIRPGSPTRAQAGSPGPPRTLAAKERQHLPLKIFFLVASLGLSVSTLTGIYMAYVYRRDRLWVTAALVAGIVLPLVLLPF